MVPESCNVGLSNNGHVAEIKLPLELRALEGDHDERVAFVEHSRSIFVDTLRDGKNVGAKPVDRALVWESSTGSLLYIVSMEEICKDLIPKLFGKWQILS